MVSRFSSRSSDGVDRLACGEQRRAAVEDLPGRPPPPRARACGPCCCGLPSPAAARAFSSVCMSARISSVSMTSMSDCGIDLAVDVHHVVVGEHPHHLADRVALADVGQELVAQPGALGGALDDPGDVDERHRRGHDLLRVEQLGQLVQPRIGQRHHALVGLDRRERVVRRQHVVARQRVEQRRLADVGQADDSEVQAHRVQSLGDARSHASARWQPLRSESRYGQRVSGQRARSTVTADRTARCSRRFRACRGGVPC